MVDNEALRHYTPAQRFRYFNETLSDRIKLDAEILATMEHNMVEEAFTSLAKRRIDVYLSTNNSKENCNDSRVYIEIDEGGNLKDIKPLLPFVSKKTLQDYHQIREVLGCD